VCTEPAATFAFERVIETSRTRAMPSRSPKPWNNKTPRKPTAAVKLTPAQIEQARQRAEAAGRRYPNLVDNMYIAAQARKQASRKLM
jgi:hypothetical protein